MYYLIEHNRNTKDTKYKEVSNYDEALKLASMKEQEYFNEKRNEMEVVLLEADSVNTLKATHSRYFFKEKNSHQEPIKKGNNTLSDLARLGISVGLVALAYNLITQK